MPKHYSRWNLKRLVAASAMIFSLSGFLGGGLGAYISRQRSTGSPSISRVVVINNYPDRTESRDITAELIPILKRLANKQITLETAITEIHKIVPTKAQGNEFIEDIKPILIGIVGVTSDEDFQKAVEAIAEALAKASESLPTPIPCSTISVRPSP